MTATLVPTDLETINTAILSHNPFSQPPFVNANNVWGKGFPDLECLNAHASDAVFEALKQIQASQYPTTSMLITAQNGTGKTHIIGRIRHRLQEQGGALFIFANKINDLNNINSSFQQVLSSSLSNIGSDGVKQWQELAALIANAAIKVKKPSSPEISAKELVERFDGEDEDKDRKIIKNLAKVFCKHRPVKDPDVVKAILWTLSEEQEPYASNWLAGKELAQYKANEMLLPSQQQSFDTVLEILDLIGDYKEIVVCFDELDSLDFNDSGLHKSQVIANFIKELLQNLRRGIILSVMMPGTWNERIKQQLPGGVSSKVTTYGNPLDLKYMDGDSIVALVNHSMSEYAHSNQLVLPHPIYPFNEEELRSLGQDKPTVREVLQWCKENCKIPSSPEAEDLDNLEDKNTAHTTVQAPENDEKSALGPVSDAFSNELSEAEQADLDNEKLLSDAILFSFQDLQGKTIDGYKIEEVTEKVGKGNRKDAYLNFKILGKTDSEFCIGVAVLQQTGGRGLGAGFKRLLDSKGDFKLTRGSLIRSKDKKMSSHIKNTYLKPFINGGGEFVALKPEEIHPLLAIHAVFRKRESDYGVTEEQIADFMGSQGEEMLLGQHNPLLREILSDPSHEVPDLAEEPEAEAIAPETDDDANDTDLSELT